MMVLLERSLLSVTAGWLRARSSVCNPSSLRLASRVTLRQLLFTNTRLHVNPETNRDFADDIDIAVFRFTLGIPGFDDAKLPCVAGGLFGGLLILNHALTIDSISTVQLRSEAAGLLLAYLAIVLPSVGERLKARKSCRNRAPGRQPLFLDSSLTEIQKSELAWGSYALLQNSNATAILVCTAGKVVCSRGWGDTPEALQGDKIFYFLAERLGLDDVLCTPDVSVAQRWNLGSDALLMQPLKFGCQGFLITVTKGRFSYTIKERLWILAVATRLSKALIGAFAEKPPNM